MRTVRIAALAVSMALAAFTAGALAEGEKPPRDLASVLEPIRARHGAPALGAAVVRGADITALGAVGLRRAGGKEKVTAADRWHLGSCTKAMTATLIARLVEKGDLAFDLTLAKAFKGVEVHPKYASVTLADLLANRGGAPPDLDADGLWAALWRMKGTRREQRMQLVRGVLPKPPFAEPVREFVYSNAGFAIAGAAAEEKTDTAWEDLLREHVFEPLGMESAGFGAPGTAAGVEHPWGHRPADGVPVPPGPAADNPPAIGPAGTVHCSLSDWARFASAHLRGAQGKDGPLLTSKTFTRLHTPPVEGANYAFGWIVGANPRLGRLLGHAGSNTMWYAVIRLAPDRGVGVVVTCNAADEEAQAAVEETVRKLLAAETKE